MGFSPVQTQQFILFQCSPQLQYIEIATLLIEIVVAEGMQPSLDIKYNK